MSEKNYLSTSDLQGIIRMATDATLGVSNLVQTMHHQILQPSFLPSYPLKELIRGITDISFFSIKTGTKLIGKGLDNLAGQLDLKLKTDICSEQKEIIRSVLNGIVGDYLVKSDNPLSINMHFRHKGNAFVPFCQNSNRVLSNVNGKILLMVHGLCMQDALWEHKGHNHGEALSEELNYTTIYLNYNSGRHISTNGQSLNLLLEQLVDSWPVQIEDFVIISHSMGGLVSRSALHYGSHEEKKWTKQLKKLIFLGTPHHGAPLERVGNYIDHILENIPWTKPFARLGKIRSAGITDLRYSNLLDEDWGSFDRFKRQGDKRKIVPLPEKVDCYSVAASLGMKKTDLTDKLLGDGIVYPDSALGKHKNPVKNIQFKPDNTSLIYDCSHLELLSKASVFQQIKSWLRN